MQSVVTVVHVDDHFKDILFSSMQQGQVFRVKLLRMALLLAKLKRLASDIPVHAMNIQWFGQYLGVKHC